MTWPSLDTQLHNLRFIKWQQLIRSQITRGSMVTIERQMIVSWISVVSFKDLIVGRNIFPNVAFPAHATVIHTIIVFCCHTTFHFNTAACHISLLHHGIRFICSVKHGSSVDVTTFHWFVTSDNFFKSNAMSSSITGLFITFVQMLQILSFNSTVFEAKAYEFFMIRWLHKVISIWISVLMDPHSLEYYLCHHSCYVECRDCYWKSKLRHGWSFVVFIQHTFVQVDSDDQIRDIEHNIRENDSYVDSNK